MKSILKDPMTKKEYELSNESNKQTATLLNVIRDRWNTKNIGFYLLRVHYRSVSDFLKENMCYSNEQEKAILTEEIVQSMRRNKYAVMNNIPGRDEFYFLPNNVKIDDTGLENVDNSMSAGAISRQLGKMFNTKRTSRVVLSKFIDQVS
jgi:cysteinyl-tRNA synthetase